MDLSRAQAFYIHEVAEVFVVCKDKNLVFATIEIVFPYLKSLDNSQKLAVIGLVLGFH